MQLTRRGFVKAAAAGVAWMAAGAGCGPRADDAPSPPARAGSGSGPSLLVLGGTGFLGPHLVEAARARGHLVTLFNRGKTNPHLFPDVEKLHGDRDGDLKALVGRKWDAVVDTSGYVPRIVKASADLLAPSVKQYVFISTISVYADTSKVGMDETAPLEKVDDPTTEDVRRHYGGLKALSEQAAEAAMPGRVANIRPGLIVGPGDPTDRFTYWPVRLSRGGEVLAPGDGRDPVQFIDARDLAEWIVTVVEKRHVGVFNATGPAERLPMASLLAACDAATPSEPKLTWVDAAFLEKEGIAPWSDMPVWVPSSGDTAGFGTVSARRAIERGLKFRPAEDTARATLAWWNELPEERRAKKMRAGLTPEREAEALAKWHARAKVASPATPPAG